MAWGQQISISGQYSLTGKSESAKQAILYQTNFESDDPDLTPTWDAGNANATLNTNMTYVHAGTKSGQYHYLVDGPNDTNVWTSKIVAGQTDIYTRAYLYLKTPEGDNTSTNSQRKLVWLSDSTSATNNLGNYQVILTGWATAGTPNYTALAWVSQGTGGGCGLTSTVNWNLANLNYDTWYSVEFQAHLNTPSTSDGYVKLWINGSLVYTSSNTDQLRGTCSGTLSFFGLGEQLNVTQTARGHEYRYWDDVVVSMSYIGP